MERDILGRATERAANLLMNTKKRAMKEFPLGPSNVRMSARDVRQMIRQGGVDQRAALGSVLGEDLTPLMDPNFDNPPGTIYDFMERYNG